MCCVKNDTARWNFGRVARHGSNPGPQSYLNQPEESNILVETTTVGYNRSQKLVVLLGWRDLQKETKLVSYQPKKKIVEVPA